MLRHPVVITSITEDFEKIGLIKKDDETKSLQEGLPKSSGGPVGSKKQAHMKGGGGSLPKGRGGPVGSGKKSHTSHRSPDHDYGTTEDVEEAAYAEAVRFAEEFAEEWDALEGDEGCVDVELSQEEMDDLESMGESFTLAGDVLDESEYEDDDEEADDEDDEEDDDMDESLSDVVDDDFFEDLELDEEGLQAKYGEDFESRREQMREMMQALEGRRRVAGKRGMMRTKRMSGSEKSAARKYYRTHKNRIKKLSKKRGRTAHGKRLAKIAKSLNMSADESVLRTMEHIESIVEDLNEDLDIDQAQAAFANIALVSEMLVKVFKASLDEDVGSSDDLVEGFTDMAKGAAEIVEFFHDNEEELDEDEISEAFTDYMETLESGLEVYESIRQQLEAEDGSEGKDEDAA
jgi:hypothetical protein